MSHQFPHLYKLFTKLSDAHKMAIGFGVIIVVGTLGIAIFCTVAYAQLSNHNPSHTTTSGELYAAELLLNQAEAYPEEAIYIMDDPNNPDQPLRYFLLRSYVEASSETDVAALHYTDEENEQ